MISKTEEPKAILHDNFRSNYATDSKKCIRVPKNLCTVRRKRCGLRVNRLFGCGVLCFSLAFSHSACAVSNGVCAALGATAVVGIISTIVVSVLLVKANNKINEIDELKRELGHQHDINQNLVNQINQKESDINKLTRGNRQLTDKNAALESMVRNLENKNTELKSKVEELADENTRKNAHQKYTIDELTRENTELKAILKATDAKYGQLVETNKELLAEIDCPQKAKLGDALKSRISELQNQNEKLLDQIAQNEIKNGELMQEKEKLNSSAQTFQEQISDLQLNNQKLLQEKQKLDLEKENLSRKQKDLLLQQEKILSENEALKLKNGEYVREQQKLNDRINSLSKQAVEYASQEKLREQEMQKIKERLNGEEGELKQQLNQLQGKYDESEKRANTLQQKCSGLESEIKNLQTQLNSGGKGNKDLPKYDENGLPNKLSNKDVNFADADLFN